MPQKITVDVEGEVFGNTLIPESWYRVRVVDTPEIKIGKDSGKKYMEWNLKVVEGNQIGAPLTLRTTLEKGEDPKKSKRWLFHQAMIACKIEKVNEKYSFALEDLSGKEFWVKVVIKEDMYNNSPTEKNEIKQVAIEPIKKTADDVKVVVASNGVFENEDEIPF